MSLCVIIALLSITRKPKKSLNVPGLKILLSPLILICYVSTDLFMMNGKSQLHANKAEPIQIIRYQFSFVFKQSSCFSEPPCPSARKYV